jgi:hypothetical protein
MITSFFQYSLKKANFVYEYKYVYDDTLAQQKSVRYQHRVHRVATAAFWRTFSHEGKISPGW